MEEYRDVFIKKSMNEEETNILEVEGRSEAEILWKNNRKKLGFLWVNDNKIMKWYIKNIC